MHNALLRNIHRDLVHVCLISSCKNYRQSYTLFFLEKKPLLPLLSVESWSRSEEGSGGQQMLPELSNKAKSTQYRIAENFQGRKHSRILRFQSHPRVFSSKFGRANTYVRFLHSAKIFSLESFLLHGTYVEINTESLTTPDLHRIIEVHVHVCIAANLVRQTDTQNDYHNPHAYTRVNEIHVFLHSFLPIKWRQNLVIPCTLNCQSMPASIFQVGKSVGCTLSCQLAWAWLTKINSEFLFTPKFQQR